MANKPARTIRIRIDLCMIDGCFREIRARGLCMACLIKARRMVDQGQTTWPQLESLGLSKPSKMPVSPFGIAFEKAMARQQLSEAKASRQPRPRARAKSRK